VGQKDLIQPGSITLEPVEQPDNILSTTQKEEKMRPLHLETSHQNIVYQLYLNKLIQAYLFGAHWQAFEHAVKAEQHLQGLTGSQSTDLFYFYDSLTRLALFPQVPQSEQAGLLDKVKRNREKIKEWSRQEPAVYLYQLYLVTAEQARALGRKAEAGIYYDKAIASLRRTPSTKEKALAHELTGKFYLAEGEVESGQGYLKEAQRIYQHWGASSKVKDLEEQYTEIFRLAEKKEPQTGIISPPRETAEVPAQVSRPSLLEETSHVVISEKIGSSFDLTRIIEASQAISAEIRLDSLLVKLIETVLENSDAQRACLVMERSGNWFIEAEGKREQESKPVLQSQLVSLHQRPPLLPLSIINVVALTQENVILDHAAKNEQFNQDPYLASNGLRSVLCMPLISRGKLMGVLYLENEGETAGFTADQRHILHLLAGQAATSIENAYLYADLETSERTYRTLFEDSKDPIFIATSTGQILDINPAGSKFSGYTKIELLRMRLSDFCANLEEWRQFQQEIEQRSALRDFELKFRRKDNILRDCLLTATGWRANDEAISGYQVLVRDVTEYKQMDRLKSSFIGVITHELRSPFVAVDLSVQLLERYLERGMYDELQDQIQQLDQELTEGRRMIDSVISFASLMSKQGDLFLEETDIAALAQEMTAPLEKMAAARNITLAFHFPPNLPHIRLDQQRIGEAIYHLVHNALKFNQDGGSVIISCRSIGSHLLFKVDDTGSGIPAEKLSSIWDAFIQTVDELQRGVEGLGLGLALVKFAVEAHGGEVMATSKVGLGSTFGFQLPLEPQR
jgi:histidine kinase